MKTNAIAVANYLIDLAVRDKKPLQQLGLMKRVYFVHGFSLALLDKPALDPCIDRVEAWKMGPVIPFIYESTKQYGKDCISSRLSKKSAIDFFDNLDDDQNKSNIAPKLEDEDIKRITEIVWKRYDSFDDSKLVELVHKKDSPWRLCYEKGKNNLIPDSCTKSYFKKHKELEDFIDTFAIEACKGEESIPWEEVKAELYRQ